MRHRTFRGRTFGTSSERWRSWDMGSGRAAEPEEPKAKPAVAGRRAVEPAAPVLPAEVVAAMQEGRFAEAEAALGKLARRGEGRRRRGPTSRWSRGSRSGSAARPTRRGRRSPRRSKAAPEGPWAAKIRLELAGVELAAGQGRRGRGARPRPRPRRCSPATARTGSPRSTTPSPAASSSPTTRSPRPTRRPPTTCSPRPAPWPRARRSAPGSSSRWAAPRQAANDHAQADRTTSRPT